jgi:hypothetical protein
VNIYFDHGDLAQSVATDIRNGYHHGKGEEIIRRRDISGIHDFL